MFDSANCLAGSDAIRVVGIGIIVKGLTLYRFNYTQSLLSCQ